MSAKEKRPVIQVTGLKKQYKLGQIGGGTLTHDLQSWWARVRGKEDPNTVIGTDQRLFGQTFMALNGVDLTVYQGEALGIIGRNGAGKSTLLKLLSRITAPTEGEIRIRGRVASMLEVGTGFNNEMTGRGKHLYERRHPGHDPGGDRRETAPDHRIFRVRGLHRHPRQAVFQRHVRQAGLRGGRPSGQRDHGHGRGSWPWGDMKFQQKCLGKMSDVANQDGRTVLYVSHNMSTIRQLCSRCIVLDKGKVIFDGDVEQAIAIYMGHHRRERGALRPGQRGPDDRQRRQAVPAGDAGLYGQGIQRLCGHRKDAGEDHLAGWRNPSRAST